MNNTSDDSFNSDIDVSSSTFDLISVASIVGDGDEFKRLQENLRKSRMLTGLGTQQILKQYIESGGREVEAKRKNDPELSKVKYFAPAQPQRRRRLGDRLSESLRNFGEHGFSDGQGQNNTRSQSLRNFGAPPAGHDIKDGFSDGLGQNHTRSQSPRNFGDGLGQNHTRSQSPRNFGDGLSQNHTRSQSPRNFGDGLSQNHTRRQSLPAGRDMNHESSDGLGKNRTRSQSLPAGRDMKHESSDGLGKNHTRSQSLRNFGGPSPEHETKHGSIDKLIQNIAHKQIRRNLDRLTAKRDMKNESSDGLGQNHTWSQSLRNFGGSSPEHETKHGFIDKPIQNIAQKPIRSYPRRPPAKRDMKHGSGDWQRQHIRNFEAPPEGRDMENGLNNRGLRDRLSQSLRNLVGPTAGRDKRHGSVDESSQSIRPSQSIENFGGSPAGRDMENGFRNRGLGDRLSKSLRNFWSPPEGLDINYGPSDEPTQTSGTLEQRQRAVIRKTL